MFVKLSALTKLSAKQSVHIFSCIKEEKVEINVNYLSKLAALLELIFIWRFTFTLFIFAIWYLYRKSFENYSTLL